MSGADVGLVDRFEGSALDGIAAIEEQDIRVGGALGVDQGCDLGEAAVRGPVGVIVDGKEIAVKIGGGEDSQLDMLGEQGNAAASEEQEKTGGAFAHVTL